MMINPNTVQQLYVLYSTFCQFGIEYDRKQKYSTEKGKLTYFGCDSNGHIYQNGDSDWVQDSQKVVFEDLR